MTVAAVDTEFERVAREQAFLEPIDMGSAIDMGKMVNRDRLVREYSWAIPNSAALDALAARGPIVEIGAHGGYWAYLLRERDVDVVAYDPELWYAERGPNGWIRRRPKVWTNVLLGDHTDVEKHADRTLFLCWPSYDEPWAAEALALYEGSCVVFVGEWRGNAADKAFFDRLEAAWEPVEEIEIPRFFPCHDSLSVWERR